jgi:uncharacterized membrane protein YeaQ/YmgE (transglycosylase-associated protein family)
MPITEILPLLLVAVVVANLGQAITGYSLGRYLIVLIVGFIGAFFGIGMARFFELPELIPVIIRGEMFPVMWSIIGSLTLLWMLSMLTHRPERESLITNEVSG